MIYAQGQELTTKVTLGILVLLTLFRVGNDALKLQTLCIITIGIAAMHGMHERGQVHFQVGFLLFLSAAVRLLFILIEIKLKLDLFLFVIQKLTNHSQRLI